MLVNFLEETKAAIEESGHTSDDIIFIGSDETDHRCNWKEFCEIANINYERKFGVVEIAVDLIILFVDGKMMWRDVSEIGESWVYQKPFKIPENRIGIKKVHGGIWDTLEDLNR